VDYRRLNTVTRKDAYPLPRIDSCFYALATAKWFSTFDLKSSYHQVMVNPSDSFAQEECTNSEKCHLDCVTLELHSSV